MTQQTDSVTADQDPDGSIFLFNRLSEREFQHHYFAILLGRGAYRGMEIDEQEEVLRELELRRAITRRGLMETVQLPENLVL